MFFSLKASTISLVRVENTKRPNKEDGLLTTFVAELQNVILKKKEKYRVSH